MDPFYQSVLCLLLQTVLLVQTTLTLLNWAVSIRTEDLWEVSSMKKTSYMHSNCCG